MNSSLNHSHSTVITGAVRAAPKSAAALLNVRDVAAMLGCSPRTVYRLADSGKIPPPMHLSSLVRWNRLEIERWIESGCRPVRQIRKIST